MKKPVLMLVALALAVALPACGKKQVPPPPPPPPVAPEVPPPAPPPPPKPEVAPQVDEYTRLKSMSADELDKMKLLADVYFDYDRADIRESRARAAVEERGPAQEVRLPQDHGRGPLRRARHGRVQPRPGREARQGGVRLPRLAGRAGRAIEDRVVRQGGPGLHRVERGLLAAEPPRTLRGHGQAVTAQTHAVPGRGRTAVPAADSCGTPARGTRRRGARGAYRCLNRTSRSRTPRRS